ncbi:MAG TPA: thioredoxin domain-containing protein [Ferruginibacter sp.]|nr:thioredoxin domain-containing protein [Ferruginibacter sp.]
MPAHSNHLVHETSPYLLQHAHNPVNWYPWGEEALRKAVAEDKPILVSIGYSACHWCHVMERESFEDEATAAVMNEGFINIKIDREERPDLDHIYMDAVQAMSGSGGWPLNVFLTPAGKPFYGGTYFPPQKAFNRPSWTDVLNGVSQAFKERRNEIEAQAENLTDHLLKANSFGMQKVSGDEVFAKEKLDEAFTNIMNNADKQWGGFGRAPKFPQTFTIQFLLRYHHVTSNKEALDQALLSLDKMIEGGIYDQVGGGFARYSTDTEWLAPHFEKMLYDNALLISVLSEAFQLTGKSLYKEVIGETIEFLQREMMHSNNGFYAALDADSEGEEGKFYVWSEKEIDELLGGYATTFKVYFDISEKGNWEGKNIPRRLIPDEVFADDFKMSLQDLKNTIAKAKEILLDARSKRIRPGLDDKIILGWNALMNTALSKAFGATGNEEYRQLAIANMQFMLEVFKEKDGEAFHHTWKNGQAKYPAFVDDYAWLIQALLQLQEITGNTQWLEEAGKITAFVTDQFSEVDTGFFFYTREGQTDIIVRKKEVYDGAVPSGNAVMADNLYHLSLLLDRPEWGQRARDMVLSLGKAIIKYPTSFGVWAGLLQEIATGTREVVVMGEQYEAVLKELLAQYIPHRVLMASGKEKNYPLLSGKPVYTKTSIWLCFNYSCKQPVYSTQELMALINSEKMGN